MLVRNGAVETVSRSTAIAHALVKKTRTPNATAKIPAKAHRKNLNVLFIHGRFAILSRYQLLLKRFATGSAGVRSTHP